MAAATMAIDNLPSSPPTSPSASYTSFTQSARSVSSPLYSRSQGSLPGTPTSSTHTSAILDLPPAMNYGDFLRAWSDSHVSAWLTNIKCGHHATTFRTSDIRGDVILELDQVTLKEIGIASVGDRLRILNAVKALRQRCSTRGEWTSTYGALRSRAVVGANDSDLGLRRTGSTTSSTSRLAGRRQEHTRPPPLQLGSSANPQPNLPHIIRDNATGSDSFRTNHVRPLPHPVSTTPSSSTTPTATSGSSQSGSSRGPHLPLPPIPRGFPPGPAAPSSVSAAVRPANRALHGRKTPTQFEAPEFTSQPLPPAPTLLTPQSATTWSGYGLPPDPKAGITAAKSPNRSQSPLPNIPHRTGTRSPVPAPTHGRNLSSGSQSNTTPTKPTQRPSGSNHPYTQSLQPSHAINVLSPIAESFPSQQTPIQPNAPSASPPPPTSFAVGRGPFANASSSGAPPSLVDLRRKLVKFMLGDEGHSATINVEDCVGGVEVLEKVLKKFGKLGAKNTDLEVTERVGTNDGGLSVDGWSVYLDWGNEASLGMFLCVKPVFACSASTGRPLTEAQLLSVCHAPPNDPARERGLTLRRVTKAKRPKAIGYGVATSPTGFVFPSKSSGHEGDDPSSTNDPSPTPKRLKRASTVSVLSGLGVEDPEKALESPSSPTRIDDDETGSANLFKPPARLRNFFGQRPTSELITNHLTEYFPFTEKKVLERTARNSMLRAGGSVGRRDSTVSFNPPSSSRFSVSSIGSRKASSQRGSVYSVAPPVPEKLNQYGEYASGHGDSSEGPPRVSLSNDDGDSLPLESGDEEKTPSIQDRISHTNLLPHVDFSLESFTESMDKLAAQDRRLSSASSIKRMSYITELRSKRDVSDSASFVTVDEITAEVESRRENDVDNGWTAINAEGDEEHTPAAPVDVPTESVGEDDDEDINLEGDMSDTSDEDDDETGRAIASGGDDIIFLWQ
jgi:mitogen-activated protein kinase kinase kinase